MRVYGSQTRSTYKLRWNFNKFRRKRLKFLYKKFFQKFFIQIKILYKKKTLYKEDSRFHPKVTTDHRYWDQTKKSSKTEKTKMQQNRTSVSKSPWLIREWTRSVIRSIPWFVYVRDENPWHSHRTGCHGRSLSETRTGSMTEFPVVVLEV